jgi:hypothetical protein
MAATRSIPDQPDRWGIEHACKASRALIGARLEADAEAVQRAHEVG